MMRTRPMSDPTPMTKPLAALALVLAFALAGCSGVRNPFAKDTTPGPKAREEPGVEARLRPLGSAISGVGLLGTRQSSVSNSNAREDLYERARSDTYESAKRNPRPGPPEGHRGRLVP